MNKTLVFDIEANGLIELVLSKDRVLHEADRVWCMVIMDANTGEEWSFCEDKMLDGVEMLRSADLIIGHNIVLYDVPLLERLYGPIHTKMYDTLIVSRLMYPDRQNHPFGGNSLKAWGEYLGCQKKEYDLGFDNYHPEMLEYCKQDVKVTDQIFCRQNDFTKKQESSIELEHTIASIIAKQINNGISFNLKEAHDLEYNLLMEKVLIDDNMSTIFEPIVEERWSDKTGKQLKSKVTHFNPASRQQIAKRLKTKYGWVAPMTDKGNPKVDSAILKKLNYPEAKALVTYFDIIKMLGQLSDWITRTIHSRDGRIHGSVNTQGTVTGRMTASQPNLQQVSGDSRMRSLFGPREGWVQVGIDASGLEARLLANRMAKWDHGDYGRTVVHGDIHTVNQKAAGLATRADAKTFFYALIYGAGDKKMGSIVGKKAKDGKAIKLKFLNEMPAIRKLLDYCKFQVVSKGTITLLDGREVPCRANHKALNVMIQGDGAIIMKYAQKILASKIDRLYNDEAAFMTTVHDEWQLECNPNIADDIGVLGVESIVEAGKLLGCLVPMDGNFRVGKDWSECH